MHSNKVENEKRENKKKMKCHKKIPQDSIELPNIIDAKIEPLFKFPNELTGKLLIKKKFNLPNNELGISKKQGNKILSMKNSYTQQRLKREHFRRHLIELIVKSEHSGDDDDDDDEILNSSRDIDINRYYYYIQNGINTVHVTTFEKNIVDNIIILVSPKFRNRFHESLNNLLKEVEDEFIISMKKSIVEFAFKDRSFNY